MHKNTWIQGFAALLPALLLLAAPWEASAQGASECGNFRFRPETPADQRLVPADQLAEAAKRGCDVDASYAIITGELDFTGMDFEGETNFWGATFQEDVLFFGATFEGDAIFKSATFGGYAYFAETVFREDADFVQARFEDTADFANAIIEGKTLFKDAYFAGNVWPPIRIGLGTDLTWNSVRDTLPEKSLTFYGAWENLFNSGGNYVEASQVRTERRRSELRPVLYSLIISFPALVLLFAGMYYPFFRHGRRSPRHLHAAKALLFSLDVVSPGVGPWKYDWKEHGGLPVERVAVLSAAESALGWLLLVLISAVIVAWVIV